MAKIKHENPPALAKRAYWLAFQACGGPLGMGVLQDRSGVTEEHVWVRITGGGDNVVAFGGGKFKPTALYADYVFGRMMKCDIAVLEDGVAFPSDEDRPPTPDYQAWCAVYPTYKSLVGAAVVDLLGDELLSDNDCGNVEEDEE